MDFLFVNLNISMKIDIITVVLHLYYDWIKNIDFFLKNYKI